MDDGKEPLSFELRRAAEDAKFGLFGGDSRHIRLEGASAVGGLLAVSVIVQGRDGRADRELVMDALRRCLRDRS